MKKQRIHREDAKNAKKNDKRVLAVFARRHRRAEHSRFKNFLLARVRS